MPQTTQCPNCGVVLTLPDGSEKRRLKCPKCTTRFELGAAPAPPPSNRPASGPHRPASSLLLSPRHDEPGVPTSDRDLRETFAPDLLFGEDKPKSTSKLDTNSRAAGRGDDIADAAALFKDDDPPATRRRGPNAASRSRPRRCTACGSVVPAGMSLCSRCGLDLDTGLRTPLDDFLDEAPPPPPPSGPPLVVSVLGGLTLLASAGLGVLAMAQSFQPGASQSGFLSLALVGAFGSYASIQFLRRKSARLLLIALMLGAVINTIALIGLPIYEANNNVRIVQDVAPGEDMQIENVASRLDLGRLKLGIFILLVDAAALVLLVAPPVRKHFERAKPGLPIGV